MTTSTPEYSYHSSYNDSRNVFIMYVTALEICLVVYTSSQALHDEDSRSQRMIMDEYITQYVLDPEQAHIVGSWGVVHHVNSFGGLHLDSTPATGSTNP
jgi:hypothetical protein